MASGAEAAATATAQADEGDADGLALLAQVEALAEDTAARMSRGAHYEAVQLLRHAYVVAGGMDRAVFDNTDEEAAASSIKVPPSSPASAAAKASGTPVVRVARASVCVLLCAVLSGIGAHKEALAAARAAEADVREAWRSLLGVVGLRDGSPVSRAVTDRLAELLSEAEKVPWLGQAAEIVVQAKHLVALELEYTGGEAAELERLHREGALLAQHLLSNRHPARKQAEMSLEAWQGRLETSGDLEARAGAAAAGVGSQFGLLARPSELVRVLLCVDSLGGGGGGHGGVPRAIPEEGEEAEEQPWDHERFPPLRAPPPVAQQKLPSLPRHERLYYGLPPEVTPADIDGSGRQRRAKHMERSIQQGASECPPTASSPSGHGMSVTWGSRSAPPGELMHESGNFGPDGVPKGRSWKAKRRVPIMVTMAGADGKSSWALRTNAEDKRQRPGRKINPFDDWKNNVAGDSKPLKDRVLETATGQADFFQRMRDESRRFRNFTLKEMNDPDQMADARILFCGEGLALKKRQEKERRAKEKAAKNALAAISSAASSGTEDLDALDSLAELSTFSGTFQASPSQHPRSSSLSVTRKNCVERVSSPAFSASHLSDGASIRGGSSQDRRKEQRGGPLKISASESLADLRELLAASQAGDDEEKKKKTKKAGRRKTEAAVET